MVVWYRELSHYGIMLLWALLLGHCTTLVVVLVEDQRRPNPANGKYLQEQGSHLVLPLAEERRKPNAAKRKHRQGQGTRLVMSLVDDIVGEPTGATRAMRTFLKDSMHGVWCMV